jgi:hypothetical protein
MHVLAPGVFIWTTDISGPAGYEPGDFTKTFNGTSSATPAVAGAAALMISTNHALSVASVRDIIAQTAVKIEGQTGWTPENGFGRLDLGSAVTMAQAAGAPAPAKAPKKTRNISKVQKTRVAKSPGGKKKNPPPRRNDRRPWKSWLGRIIKCMGAYYYAGGERVDLEPDEEHVAVDQAVAKEAGLNVKIRAASAAREGAGVVVTPRSSLTSHTLSQLEKAGALQPVYRRDNAVVVAMPEVRVEFDSPVERGRVKRLLRPKASRVSVTEDTTDRLVIKPLSGKGDDALNLANRIHERVNPAAVSVRFVQFVPKPKMGS